MQPDGNYVLTTSSGRGIDLNDPRPENIEVEDIAGALSRICRFGAQSQSFYSVAQHAIEVSAFVPSELKLAALHHDSHEAFACDLPSPLKRLIRASSGAYDTICSRLDVAIGARIGIDPVLFDHPAVKRADQTVLVMESRGLLADEGRQIRKSLAPREFLAVSSIEESGEFRTLLTPEEAELAFLEAHRALSAAASPGAPEQNE